MDRWLREYFVVALRIDRAAKAGGHGWFVDHFLGPTGLPKQIAEEPARPWPALLHDVDALEAGLTGARFSPARHVF